ncbi:MAG: hypothetical protein KIS77_19875 [Saprospiraceae bacterium]|nr:hypothetical protein [Saprospiraceae bacterium]
MQLRLRFDAERWEFVGVSAGDLPQVTEACFNLSDAARGEIRFAWYAGLPEEHAREGQSVFWLTLRRRRGRRRRARDSSGRDLMPAMAFNARGGRYGLRLGEPAKPRQDAPPTTPASPSPAPQPDIRGVRARHRRARGRRPAVVLAFGPFGRRLLRRETPLTGPTTSFIVREAADCLPGCISGK